MLEEYSQICLAESWSDRACRQPWTDRAANWGIECALTPRKRKQK